MKVLVLGAGVIGVSTAYYLHLAGHEVTVLDREAGPALGCSQANGGFLAPSYCAPWAAPGVPSMAMRNLFDRTAPFRWRPDFTLAQLRWLKAMAGQCDAAHFAVNRRRMLALGLNSRERLSDVEQATGITFERSRTGVLQLCQSANQQGKVQQQATSLKAQGFDAEWLERDAVIRMEPALALGAPALVGALCLRDEGSGRCETFTAHLAEWLRRVGVKFHWNSSVEGFALSHEGTQHLRQFCALRVNGQTLPADACVVATGADTARLLKPYMDVPVYPVKGYSMTATVIDAARAPNRAVVDERSKLAIVRLDDAIRVAAYADVVGHDRRLDPDRCAQLATDFERLYPGAIDLPSARFWAGLRPMTPDGTPIIGTTAVQGLLLNTGHGTYGWTLSCGSAKLCSDILSNHPTELPTSDYALARYADML